MAAEKALRMQLAEFVDWQHAHLGFDVAIKGIPPRLRGTVPKGFVHSIWQVVEHLRIAQADILDFCVNPLYVHDMQWPDDYWPRTPAPRSAAAWTKAIAAIRRDRKAMQRLAMNPRIDLLARIPHGSGQTYMRELLLVGDHAAYHIAQIVDIRRALGNWK
jgi:DinB superfamily